MVDDISLVPIEKVTAPAATKTIEVEVIFDTMDDGTNRAMFNQVTYNSPKVPAILSTLTLGSDAVVEKAYGPLSFVVGDKEVVDLVVKNGDAGKHPLYDFSIRLIYSSNYVCVTAIYTDTNHSSSIVPTTTSLTTPR